MERFYLQLNAVNLGYYFNQGCVCPASYIIGREEDIQSKFDHSLLLCNAMFTNETDCSLEIVLTDDDLNLIEKKTNRFLLFDGVLPISRVKQVLFKSKDQRMRTIWNINEGAAFIPEKLVIVPDSFDTIDHSELSVLICDKEKSNFKEKIQFYNRLLGGFSLMRLGGESWMNYSHKYFLTLSLINSLIKKEVDRNGIVKGDDYQWAIFDTDKQKKFRSQIYSKITIGDVKEFAKSEKVEIKEKFGNIQLHNIEQKSITYLLAILATYGEGHRKKIDDIFSDFANDKLPQDRKEGIMLTFGLNQGYKAFRNRYKSPSVQVDTMFRLNSRLDYYTIESIYQFVFNNRSDNHYFPYLDNFLNDCNWLDDSDENFITKDYEVYKILDKDVIYKKKVQVGSPEYLLDLSENKTVEELIQRTIAIVKEWVPPFMKIENELEAVDYFSSRLADKIKLLIENVLKKVKNDVEGEEKLRIESLERDNIYLRKELDKFRNQKTTSLSVENSRAIDKKETGDTVEWAGNEVTRRVVNEPEVGPKEKEPRGKKGDEFPFVDEKDSSSVGERSELGSDSDKIILRLNELKGLNINKLKSIASSMKIKNVRTVKKADKELFCEKIVRKEFSLPPNYPFVDD